MERAIDLKSTLSNLNTECRLCKTSPCLYTGRVRLTCFTSVKSQTHVYIRRDQARMIAISFISRNIVSVYHARLLSLRLSQLLLFSGCSGRAVRCGGNSPPWWSRARLLPS